MRLFTQLKNNKHLFTMSSKELIFDGYQAVYGVFEEDDDKEITKETFLEKEILTSTDLDVQAKQTTPPARYKEATFIKELEKRGIGRPSTFASIVETLLSTTRGYCEVIDKYLVATTKGIELSRFLDKNFSDVINLNYTSELERDLDLIASNKMKELDFLTEFYNKLIDSVES